MNLADHIEKNLGAIEHVVETERGYSLAHTRIPDPGVASVITNGVRFHRLAATLPEEFTCSLRQDQGHIARYLVDTIAALAVVSGRGLEFDQVVRNDEPIIPDTAICGLLASQSPFFGDDFDLYVENGRPRLQIITLLPLTDAEADHAERADAESMYEVWHENRTNILDVYRASAI